MKDVTHIMICLLGVLSWSLGSMAQIGQGEGVPSQTTVNTIRIGDMGRLLSDQDVRDLERVLPDGGRPWLLSGDRSQRGGMVQTIKAFLPPTTTLPNLRRGSIITVTRNLATSATPATAWRIETRGGGNYAQVAIEGRNFNEIRGDQDLNRPFLVTGSFDDAELISLVTLLRSNPEFRAGVAVQALPILDVRRTDDLVMARLSRASMSVQVITLKRQGQGWAITAVGEGAA